MHRGPGGDPLPRDIALRGAGQRGLEPRGTGGPADPPTFTYRVMYPAAGLLGEGILAEGLLAGLVVKGARRLPRFREPVIADPGLAAELRRLHAALGAGLGETRPLEAESRLSWLFGELVRRHASPSRDCRGTGGGPGGPAGDGAACPTGW